MSKPKAVLISDIHFSLSTIAVASAALLLAIEKAEELHVPLIICGDLTDTKAIIRAEVANALIRIFKKYKVKSYLLVGNHDLINEKSKEHALHFLEPYCTVISSPVSVDGFNFIPYQSDPNDFLEAIRKFRKGSTVIAHQGTKGGYMGDYIQDRSAFDPKEVEDYKVYLGHYHRHYELDTTVSIGNPYTLTFGEANDGPKGFLVLYEGGKFSREILNLRSHLIYDFDIFSMDNYRFDFNHTQDDIIWVKLRGDKSQLDATPKSKVESLLGRGNFKLDKIPRDSSLPAVKADNSTSEQVLDSLVDATSEPDHIKAYLKTLWRDLCG